MDTFLYMKIPKTINILSEIYTIIEESDFFEVNGEILRGHVNFEKRIIRVYNPNFVSALKTFYHEVAHIICHELNLYDNEHNEKFIDTFAIGLADTLIRNKLIKGD